jgi:hypothetical protein
VKLKRYVLEILYNEETDEIELLQEYVDNDDTVIRVDDKKLKLEKNVGSLLDSNIVGVS